MTGLCVPAETGKITDYDGPENKETENEDPGVTCQADAGQSVLRSAPNVCPVYRRTGHEKDVHQRQMHIFLAGFRG